MKVYSFAEGESVVHRLDARFRFLAALALAGLVAVCQRPAAASTGLVLGVLLVVSARLKPIPLLKRLRAVNLFLLLLWVLLPVSVAGEVVGRLGPLSLTREGIWLALLITLKCNAIMLVVTALVGTVEPVHLGQALHALRLPDKLVHLLLFTVRYFEVLSREYRRLADALRVRCFHPRTDRHTYRTYAYLIGMLLVRSVDRAQRVSAAMRMRGFRGRFYVLGEFGAGWREAVFTGLVLCGLGLLGWTEWIT